MVFGFLFASDSHPYEHYITPPAIITTVLIDRRPNKPSTKTNKASYPNSLFLSSTSRARKPSTSAIKAKLFRSQAGSSGNVTFSSVSSPPFLRFELSCRVTVQFLRSVSLGFLSSLQLLGKISELGGVGEEFRVGVKLNVVGFGGVKKICGV